MNQDKQPEALRLAGRMEWYCISHTIDADMKDAARELRRLHAESEQHLQDLRSYRITVENREARIAELEARLAAVQGVPDGWALVPKTPTDEQLRAGYWSGGGEVRLHEEWARRESYERMVQNAPQSPETACNPRLQPELATQGCNLSLQPWQSQRNYLTR